MQYVVLILMLLKPIHSHLDMGWQFFFISITNMAIEIVPQNSQLIWCIVIYLLDDSQHIANVAHSLYFDNYSQYRILFFFQTNNSKNFGWIYILIVISAYHSARIVWYRCNSVVFWVSFSCGHCFYVVDATTFFLLLYFKLHLATYI